MSQPLTTYSGNRSLVSREHHALATHCRPLRFHAELFVEHSPAEVWSLFSDLERWTKWSPICRGCRLRGDHKELQVGSILEISFVVAGLVLTVPATVVHFDPPTSIAWHGKKFGIRAIHSYRFLPRKQGTLLCNEETFFGAAFPLGSLLSAWYRSCKLSSESLGGIKRELAGAPGVTK